MNRFLLRIVALMLVPCVVVASGPLPVTDNLVNSSGHGSRVTDHILFTSQALALRSVNTLATEAKAEAASVDHEAAELLDAAELLPEQPGLSGEIARLVKTVDGMNLETDYQKVFDLVIPYFRGERRLQAPSQASALLTFLRLATKEMQPKGLITASERIALYQIVVDFANQWIASMRSPGQPVSAAEIVLAQALAFQAEILSDSGKDRLLEAIDSCDRGLRALPSADSPGLSPNNRKMRDIIQSSLRYMRGKCLLGRSEETGRVDLLESAKDLRLSVQGLDEYPNKNVTPLEKAAIYNAFAGTLLKAIQTEDDPAQKEAWTAERESSLQKAGYWTEQSQKPEEDPTLKEISALQEKISRDPEKGGLYFDLAELLLKANRSKEALAAYRSSLRYMQTIQGWPPQRREMLFAVMDAPDPAKTLAEMKRSKELFDQMRANASQEESVFTMLVYVLFEMGHLTSNLEPSKGKTVTRARNLFTAAVWIGGDHLLIPLQLRILSRLELSFELSDCGDYDEALPYADQAQILSHQGTLLLTGRGRELKENVVSRSNLAKLREHLEKYLKWFSDEEAMGHYLAGRALRHLLQWQAAAPRLETALKMGLEKDSVATARMMLGWDRYHLLQTKTAAGAEEITGARSVLEHMDRVLHSDALDIIKLHAAGLKSLVAAKQQEWDGAREAALQGLIAGCAALLEIDSGPSMTNVESFQRAIEADPVAIRARLESELETETVAREFFRAIERLADILGQAKSVLDIQRVVRMVLPRAEPAKTVEPDDESKPKESQKSPDEALAELAEMTRGPMPTDGQLMMARLSAVYDTLNPLRRYQDILNAFDPAIDWLNQQWQSTHSTTPIFGLGWVFYLRALTFIDLGQLPEAFEAVELGYNNLNVIKDICLQRHMMAIWQAAWNCLQLAQGESLRRRWEKEKDRSHDADLWEALNMLTPVAEAMSGRPGTGSARTAHADVFASLGWVQFHLHGIERSPSKSALFLDQAEKSAAKALAANPKNANAIGLRDAVTKARHAAAELEKRQQTLLAAVDAELRAGHFQAAAEELDKLEQAGWPALRVVYYRGLIEYQAARHAAVPEEILAHDRRASEIWSAHSAKELAGAWDTADKAREVRYTLIESQVRVGHVPEAIAMVMTEINLGLRDTALAQRLVDALPDAESYEVASEELLLLQPSPAVDAFATHLETCLTRKQLEPAWRERALASVRHIKSVVLQRQAKEQWASLPKGDAKALDKFFSRKPWEPLTPEPKARLLIFWAPAFLTVSKQGKEGQAQAEGRKLVIARFVDEVRKAVKAGVTEERGVVRVSIGKKVLEDVQRFFVTDMEGTPKNAYGFNIRNISQITDVLRGLKNPLQLGLAFYNAQTAEEDFAEVERAIEALAAKTDIELMADPVAAGTAVGAQEKNLEILKGKIPPGPAGQELSDRLPAMTHQIETERRRVVTAPWRGLQRRVADLKDDVDDTTLAAIDKDLGGLQPTLKRKAMTPEPADLPDQVSRSLDFARQRMADYRLSQERDRVARDRAAFEEKVRRLHAAWQASLTGLWNALERDLGGVKTDEDGLRLPGLRMRMTALEAASMAVLELAGRPAAFEVLWETAVQRIKRNEEMASRFKEIMEHPLARSLIPKDLVPQSYDEALYLIAASLNVPSLDDAIRAHFLTWLKGANESEWLADELDPETGYAISRAVQERLRLNTDASQTSDLGRRRNILDRAYDELKQLKKLSTTPIRPTGTTATFTSAFEFDHKRTVQCEHEMTDIPGLNGNARPILLRLGPAAAKTGASSVRIAVLLPTPARGTSAAQAAAALGVDTATRAALLMGLGFGQAEAAAVAQVHEQNRTSFEHYRLHELVGEERRRRLKDYRLARSNPDSEDTEAPRRTLLAIGLAESETGGSLNGFTSAVADTQGETSAEALALARFDFIHQHLAAWPTANETPAAASRAVSELGALFDAWITAVRQAAAQYGHDMDAVAALHSKWASMHEQREKVLDREREAERGRLAQEESQTVRQAGVAGLIEELKEFLLNNRTLEGAERWVRDAEYVLPGLKGPDWSEFLPLVQESLAEIRASIASGEIENVWWAFYARLGYLNHYLFAPAIQRWLWLEYDGGIDRPQVAHVDETPVFQLLPLNYDDLGLPPHPDQSYADVFTFLLTRDEHLPSYRHSQRLALVSIPWLRSRAAPAPASFTNGNPRARWEFERSVIAQEVIDQLARAMDTILMREPHLQGLPEGVSPGPTAVIKPASDLARLRPTEAEVLEIARLFRSLIMANSLEQIRSRLHNLFPKVLAQDRAAKFVWEKVFTKYGINPRQQYNINQLIEQFRRFENFSDVRGQLESLMSFHLLLPPSGGLLPRWDNDRLPDPTCDLLKAVYKAMGLDTPPENGFRPQGRGNGGESRPGSPHRAPGRPGTSPDRSA